jgi:hypothetical protein
MNKKSGQGHHPKGHPWRVMGAFGKGTKSKFKIKKKDLKNMENRK